MTKWIWWILCLDLALLVALVTSVFAGAYQAANVLIWVCLGVALLYSALVAAREGRRRPWRQ